MPTTHSPVVRAAAERMGEAFEARRLTAERFDGLMDPLLLVDHFRMSAETFAAHPHAGFSPLTLLFEDSSGSIRNRDSQGVDLVIAPGDLLWTLAGRGVIHLENPVTEGPVCHGLQIWVNLPAREKGREPLVRHLRARQIPAQVRPGVRVRVVAGEWAGVRSPLEAPQPLALLDGFLAPGAPFGYELPPGWNGLLYLVEGGITLEWRGRQIPLAGSEAIALQFPPQRHVLHAVIVGVLLAKVVEIAIDLVEQYGESDGVSVLVHKRGLGGYMKRLATHQTPLFALPWKGAQ